MDFPVKTERQIIEESLIEADAECDFEVIKAEDAVSKKGNDMIALTLRVFRPDGRTAQLRDWLMPSIPMKLLKFCEATGLAEQYHTGTLQAADCMGRAGRLIVGIQSDKSGQFPDQNCVKKYVAAAAGEEKSPVSEKEQFEPADIPF